MNPVFTFDEIREAEKDIIEKENVPSLLLMENAGRNSFNCIAKEFPDLEDFIIYLICGKGNNAGDGFTLARHFLINKIPVNVICLINPSDLKGDALINYELLTKSSEGSVASSAGRQGVEKHLSFMSFEQFKKYLPKAGKALIVDAILGTGIKGKLDEIFAQAIEFLNKTKSKKNKIVSLDVPSGLMSDEQINPAVNADYTITMGAYKTELLFGAGKENSGKLSSVSIGVDNELIEEYNSYGKHYIEFSDVKNLFPKRKKTSHKYANGKVLIIGGSKGLSGAIIMSSLSAVKSGAGGVVAAIPKSISTHFSRKLYEVMKVELDETEEGTIRGDQFNGLGKRVDWADVVLLGPGISTNEQTKQFVFDVVQNCSKDMVIDADALTLLSSDISILKKRKNNNQIILTPHLGEFSRLLNFDIREIQTKRFDCVRNFVQEYKVSLVLKSETSICCSNTELRGAERGGSFLHENVIPVFINSSGNEALATAGSGDVLSGIIASLFGQTKDPYRAMICGNYLHGLCADLYFAKYKNKQTASPQDFIKLIPDAISRILN